MKTPAEIAAEEYKEKNFLKYSGVAQLAFLAGVEWSRKDLCDRAEENAECCGEPHNSFMAIDIEKLRELAGVAK